MGSEDDVPEGAQYCVAVTVYCENGVAGVISERRREELRGSRSFVES